MREVIPTFWNYVAGSNKSIDYNSNSSKDDHSDRQNDKDSSCTHT